MKCPKTKTLFFLLLFHYTRGYIIQVSCNLKQKKKKDSLSADESFLIQKLFHRVIFVLSSPLYFLYMANLHAIAFAKLF